MQQILHSGQKQFGIFLEEYSQTKTLYSWFIDSATLLMNNSHLWGNPGATQTQSYKQKEISQALAYILGFYRWPSNMSPRVVALTKADIEDGTKSAFLKMDTPATYKDSSFGSTLVYTVENLSPIIQSCMDWLHEQKRKDKGTNQLFFWYDSLGENDWKLLCVQLSRIIQLADTAIGSDVYGNMTMISQGLREGVVEALTASHRLTEQQKSGKTYYKVEETGQGTSTQQSTGQAIRANETLLAVATSWLIGEPTSIKDSSLSKNTYGVWKAGDAFYGTWTKYIEALQDWDGESSWPQLTTPELESLYDPLTPADVISHIPDTNNEVWADDLEEIGLAQEPKADLTFEEFIQEIITQTSTESNSVDSQAVSLYLNVPRKFSHESMAPYHNFSTGPSRIKMLWNYMAFSKKVPSVNFDTAVSTTNLKTLAALPVDGSGDHQLLAGFAQAGTYFGVTPTAKGWVGTVATTASSFKDLLVEEAKEKPTYAYFIARCTLGYFYRCLAAVLDYLDADGVEFAADCPYVLANVGDVGLKVRSLTPDEWTTVIGNVGPKAQDLHDFVLATNVDSRSWEACVTLLNASPSPFSQSAAIWDDNLLLLKQFKPKAASYYIQSKATSKLVAVPTQATIFPLTGEDDYRLSDYGAVKLGSAEFSRYGEVLTHYEQAQILDDMEELEKSLTTTGTAVETESMWWIWVLLALLVIIIIIVLVSQNSNKTEVKVITDGNASVLKDGAEVAPKDLDTL